MATHTGAIYNDFSQLTELKAAARQDKDAALDKVASQFESIFVNMMLKSMRDASMGGGLGDSSQTKFYQEMFDNQISVDLSAKGGIGIADAIKRQLSGVKPESGKNVGLLNGLNRTPVQQQALFKQPKNSPVTGEVAKAEPASLVVEDKVLRFDQPKEFIETLMPYAQQAADQLGLPAEALIAQAALETGWGKHMMQTAQGDNAHNLFGIKAGTRWSGDKVNKMTLEYEQGVTVKKRDAFRAYDSWESGFNDYARFIAKSPRYQQALAVSDNPEAYFDELQKAGYATDPEYANKIKRILHSDVMNEVRIASGERYEI